MNAVGGHRAVEGCGGGLCVRDSRHRNPTNGRQGKKPAFGAAYVVGPIEQFGDTGDMPCWPCARFVKANQRTERRRAASRPGFPP
jgi:hypothetical protein